MPVGLLIVYTPSPHVERFCNELGGNVDTANRRRRILVRAFAVVTTVVIGLMPLLPGTFGPAAAAERLPAEQASDRAEESSRRSSRTAPAVPLLSVADPYRECLANDCPAAGGPGTSATVTATPTDGGPLAGARYWSTVTDTWAPMTKSGHAFSASFTPDRGGLVQVTVQLVDKDGVAGQPAELGFLVKAGEGPIARWHFGESSGPALDSATEADSAQQNATLYGGAVREDRGRRGVITHDAQGDPLETPLTDLGMILNGNGAYAATAGPVLETRAAYTVSAWVRLDSADADGVVVSQDGQSRSPFTIRYDAALGTWVFGVTEGDADAGQISQVAADHSAPVGVWTHVAGSYDPAAQELSFYVNGRPQGSSNGPGSWAATGDFQIGREQWAGDPRSYFHGSIDEVAVWQRELTSEEIADEASTRHANGQNGIELVAAWDPSTASGATVTDPVSGYGHGLTLAGGATLDGEALVLDGVDGHATVQEPVVDSTGSFTATASLELAPDIFASAPVGTRAPVLEQPAADGVSWSLWFEVTGHRTVLDEDFNEKTVTVGRWHFGREGAVVTTDHATVVDGGVVRVTGVHNAQDGTISLYLSDVQQGVATPFTAQPGQGAFTVGRSTRGDFLKGRILDARLWVGAVSGRQQLTELLGN